MEDGLNVVLREDVFAFPEDIFQRLEKEIDYLPAEQCKIRVKGKEYPISRKIVAFGDPGLSYTFSGLTLSSQPWSPILLEIKNCVESLMGVNFNFVLVNRYEDGNACIGQHKDDETDLEENYPIGSLSFGESRTIVFKRPQYEDKRIELKTNSLLIMNPPTNKIWSHGIPRQPKRSGVRINLTFRKMNTRHHNMKRKLDDDQPNEGSKKSKKEIPHSVVFKEDDIPEGMIQIGDSIFVYVSSFRGSISMHIRRFKKFGKTFYPTKEGVTLKYSWIKYIVNRNSLPEKVQELQGDMPEDEIKIDTEDFQNFTFTRLKIAQGGETVTKSIILTSAQWNEMIKRYNDIMAGVLDYVYSSMDFLDAYKSLEEDNIDECLPDSLDVSLGTQCLLELLRDSVSDCIKKNGGLRDPELLAEELWANRKETFNSAALTVNSQNIAETFCRKIWEVKDFLLLSKPVKYVTVKFLKEVRLQDILKEVRSVLCPADAFEYFEDVESQSSYFVL